jgi:arylsulfatase A
MEYMTEHRSESWFIAYNMVLAHEPRVRVPDGPATGTSRQLLIKMVEYADKMLGKVLNHLKSLGLENKTVVIFAGDNGSEPTLNATVKTPNGLITVKGAIGHPTHAGTNVPFIVRWPGVVRRGSRNDNIIDSTILLPTLADIAGEDAPSGVDGYSIVPQLRGNKKAPRDWIFMLFNPKPYQSGPFNQFASAFVQDRQYKYYGIHQCQGEAFFDILADRRELKPIKRSQTTAAQRAAWDRLQKIYRGRNIAPKLSSCS